jgi:sugar-specific transcriptional regulator TrmB
MLPELKKLLDTLGLSTKESEVLSILLQFDSLLVKDLAKKARLNRTTTYGILKTLVDKGLVSSIVKYGVREYQSIEPALLPTYIERQEELLRERKKEIKNILPQIQKIRGDKSVFPKLYFFEGLDGLKQAYEDTLENNTGKLIEEFTGPDAMFEELGQKKWVEYYIKKRVERGIACRIIAPNTTWSQWTKNNDAASLRVTKLIPEKYQFATEVVLYDNKVGLFSFSKEKPMAIIIEDDNICATMRTLFRYVDDGLKK